MDSPANDETKVCPFCAETIKRAAIVCRYCGRELPPLSQVVAPRVAQANKAYSVVTPPVQKTSNGPNALGWLFILMLGGAGVLVIIGGVTSLFNGFPSASAPREVLRPTLVPGTPTEALVPTATLIPTPTPVQPTGVTFEQICDVDESNMTDPQLAAHAAQFAGQSFTLWQGWIYDVVSRADGSYNLEIAMEERGFIWARNIVVENIPTELALRLNVEQPLVFNGRVARVDYMFEVMCNPMTVDSLVIQE